MTPSKTALFQPPCRRPARSPDHISTALQLRIWYGMVGGTADRFLIWDTSRPPGVNTTIPSSIAPRWKPDTQSPGVLGVPLRHIGRAGESTHRADPLFMRAGPSCFSGSRTAPGVVSRRKPVVIPDALAARRTSCHNGWRQPRWLNTPSSIIHSCLMKRLEPGCGSPFSAEARVKLGIKKRISLICGWNRSGKWD